jgi:hypothetical protein
MVRRRTPDPPQIQVRKFTLTDIDKAIAKLRNQIDQVRKLGSLHVSFDDSRVQSVEFNITETIREVFGDNSPEFNRYRNPHHMARIGFTAIRRWQTGNVHCRNSTNNQYA